MRGLRLSRRFRLVRKVGTVLAVLVLPPLLMGAGMPSGHAPLPTAAGVHGAVVRLVDLVTGKQPPKTPVPAQQKWPTPGNQRQATASAGRNVARAEGYKPGQGKGQLPAYTFPAAKVKRYVTGSADPGTVASYKPATSTLVTSGSTAASKLYKNADGSYTRLESPAAAGPGQATFAPLAGTGVKGTNVTSVALRVDESWAGGCPSTATVSVSDAAGQNVGRWSGRLSAPGCGASAPGGWVTVPLTGAGVKALSAKAGARLTVTATAANPAAPAAASPVTPASTAPLAAPAGTVAAGGAVLAVTAAAATLPQVNAQWPPDGYNSPTITPELLASASDSDGGALQYNFTVYQADGVPFDGTGWQSGDDVTVPAGDFSWGQTYYWTVQVREGTNTAPASPMYAMSTPVPQPLVSSDLAQDGAAQGNGDSSTGPGYDAQNGNFTTEATDASESVVGPPLSIQRTYNSLDGSGSGAFGVGWTSVLDMTVRPGQLDGSGSPVTQIITYPDGEQVTFGLNSSGAYTSPQGRYGTLVPNSGGGFQFVDKNDTTYVLSQSLGSNVYGLSSMYDGQDHTLNFTYSGNEITKIESAVSQRSLTITWSYPSGATYPHVATVATDDATAGNSSTAITWQYHYSGDQLTSACNESESGTPCTNYSYTAGSDYPAAVEDTGPTSYWRLDETSGSVAASSVLANEGADNGTYVNPEFNFASSPLYGEPSSVQVAGFNGTSSYVQLPASLGNDGAVRSVSLWFASNSTSEVLMSQSADPITDSSTSNPYTPIMYIGADGKLEAGFGGTPLSSTSAVDDYHAHNAVLTANGSTETLYVDGKQVASQSETTTPFIEPYTYVGAGFLGGTNPDEAHSGSTPTATYFNGGMSDTATWDRTLTAAEVSTMFNAATTTAALITKITRPSGKVFGQVSSYDPATSKVTSLTDSNGGSWTVNAPTVSGTSQVYTAAVKGGQPVDYWRLGDVGTSTAVNQLNGGTATYNNVTQGVSGGPFADSTVDSFNGTSSYLAMPNSLVTQDNESVSLWFKTTGTDEVLFSSSADSPANGDTSNGFTPNVYVGQDGKLNAEFDYEDSPLITSAKVNDGQWHNVVLTADTTGDETLYVDGKQVQTVSGETLVGGTAEGQDQVFVGTGFLGSDWADQPYYSTTNSTGYPSFFTGDIADVAVYPHEVSAGDVTAMWAAAQHSQGLSPVQTTTAKDPSTDQLTYQFDPLNSGRMLSYTDGLGNATTYGYDSAGFQDQVIDPNGDFTDTGYDIRGNAVSTTSCQDQATLKCGTSYATYSPAGVTTPLSSPWGSNDLIMTYQDPRSSSPTDTTYETTYVYDGNGDLTSKTTPPVPESSSGRTTNYLYTASGSTAGGYNGATPPPNLQYQVTDPRGEVTQTLYDANGDVGETINANSVKTQYTYDGLGRKISQKVISDTEPNGVTTSYSYDADNRVVLETDPPFTDPITAPGSTTQVTHTPQVTTTYDLDGDITSQVTADTTGGDTSRTVSYTYNSYDQKQSYTDAAGNQTKYTSYDGYGNLLSETDAAGNVTNYTYDDDSRLKTTTLANYSGGVAGQTGSTITEDSRDYDPAGRLISDTDATGRVTSYAYTDNGLTATVTESAPRQRQLRREESDTYDAAGNLTAKVTNNGATTTDYAVDAGNQVTSQTVDPNGTLDRVTSYTYDPDDNVTSQSVAQGSNSAIQSTSYTYDAMGNKTTETLTDPGAEGPVGWWPLTQPSGTTVSDYSGTGNLATASGVTWTSGDGAQLSGQSGQDITTRGPVVDTTGSFSVSAWVDLAGTTGSDEEVASQDAGSVAGFYLKYNSANGHWQFTRPEADVSNPSELGHGRFWQQRADGDLDVPHRRLQRGHRRGAVVRRRHRRRRQRRRRRDRLDAHRLPRPGRDRGREVGRADRVGQLRREDRRRRGLPDRPVRGRGQQPGAAGKPVGAELRRRHRPRRPHDQLRGRPARPGHRADRPRRADQQLRLRPGRPPDQGHRAAGRHRVLGRRPLRHVGDHPHRLQHLRRHRPDAGRERQHHHLHLQR